MHYLYHFIKKHIDEKEQNNKSLEEEVTSLQIDSSSYEKGNWLNTLSLVENSSDLSNFSLFDSAKQIKIIYKVFLIKEKDTVLQADRYSIPYMFVLVPRERFVHDLFFPEKEIPARTHDYFNTIIAKYFNKNDD